VKRDSVFLVWKGPGPEAVEGYHVYRADGSPDSMKRVTRRPVRARRFVESGLPERTAHFYAIASADDDGNESALSPVVLADVLDFGSPGPPKGISIRSDTGMIELRWQGNAEKDLLGYHVFKATKDTLREHFFQATRAPIRQPVFVDRVPRGADYQFHYRLVAVDSTFNFSEFSPIVSGKLPDSVPPLAPVWRDVRVHEDRIQLSWGSNPERDIAGYNVYRRPGGTHQWIKLNATALSPTITQYADTSAMQGKQYEYMLQAVDDARNISKQSTVVAARRYDADRPQAPASIEVTYDSTRHRILLRWERPPDNTLRGVVVFRSMGEGGKFVQRSRLLQDAAFTDSDVKKGERYHYRLRAYDTSGNVSEFSRPVRVTAGRVYTQPMR
jgi:fibronectin type 3 domain-containing protein